MLYRNELDKACFTHDQGYSDSNYLTKRTVSGKSLKNRASIKLLEIVDMMDIKSISKWGL